MKTNEITHKEFLKNTDFINACSKANVLTSTRQASKYRRSKGIARKVSMRILPPLKKGMPGASPSAI